MPPRSLPPLPKLLPNGRRPCRGCGAKVPKGRLTWCGNECRDKHYMGLSAFARAAVWKRDHGVCALCGNNRSAWEADHIVPLVMGGSNDISNYRTLCVKCHKAETAKLARSRSKRGRQTELGLSHPEGA
jgi:hypothetical protein